MAYAVFTRRAGPHDPAALKAAFEATPLVTAIDAQRALRPDVPGGVVTVGLEEQVARALAQELTSRGIRADAVEEAWLTLPQPQNCRRCTVTASELVFHVYDGPLHVPHDQVVCIACGVLTTEKVVSQGLPESRRSMARKTRRVVDTGFDRKRVSSHELIVDLVIQDPPRRLRLRSDNVAIPPKSENSAYRGGRDVQHHLSTLVVDISKHADTAALSLGAERIVKGAKAHRYTSNTEFAQELAWLVWRYRGPAVDGLTTPLGASRLPPGTLVLEPGTRSAALDAHMEASSQTDQIVGGVAGFLTAAGMCTLMFDAMTSLAIAMFALLWFVFGAAAFLTVRGWRERNFLSE